MPKILPAPIRAIQAAIGGIRGAYRQSQEHARDDASQIQPSLPDRESTPPASPEAPPRSDDDLRHCAWNGSIGDGILRKIHRERRDAVVAGRTANAIQLSALTNRLAALEAELSVLVEQPPKAPPSSTVLEIGPSRKGA